MSLRSVFVFEGFGSGIWFPGLEHLEPCHGALGFIWDMWFSWGIRSYFVTVLEVEFCFKVIDASFFVIFLFLLEL